MLVLAGIVSDDALVTPLSNLILAIFYVARISSFLHRFATEFSRSRSLIIENCNCVLLDIEGTTSSISYVHDEMFPYVRSQLPQFLQDQWGQAELKESIELIAEDAKLSNWPDSNLPAAEQQQQVIDEVNRQMDLDLKATGLKDLQGKIWKAGFHSGALKAHLYPEVKRALEAWKSAGKELRIYSSGSVKAQLLFFGHTVEGNLLDLFSSHFDTQIGGKKESKSYERIVADIDCSANDILFISDVVEELDAAKSAGLQTALSIRPGNAPQPEQQAHPAIHSFDEIQFA